MCACDQPPAEVEKPVEGVSGTVDHNVKIDMPGSLTEKVQKQIDEEKNADAEGKAAAGLKP